MEIDWPVSLIIIIAIINGFITSIVLETIILIKHKRIKFNIDIYVIYKHFDYVFIKKYLTIRKLLIGHWNMLE